jgi:hypothetical protein
MTTQLTRPPSPPPSALKIRYKRQDSIRAHFESLFLDLRGRRDPITGEAQTSQVMWHLVAAVLSIKGYLSSDPTAPMLVGDELRIGNTVIHVTHCPEWPLMHECFSESDRGLRPLVVSTHAGAALAESLAEEVGCGRRIEVLDIMQFLVANILEWTGFDGQQRRGTFEELVTHYNSIIDRCETDASLKIEIA